MVNVFLKNNDINSLSISEVVKRIIHLNEGLTIFWKDAKGWAPIEAASLLSKSRLDWQASLSHSLMVWVEKNYAHDDSGSLILAWTNLGSLVEGTLKLFLSVYYKDYLNDKDKIIKRGKIQDPDCLMLESLRCFCDDKMWNENDDWDNWILHIQQRRNAIHAFKNRDIGDFNEFYVALRKYLEFLRYINSRLPYPDDIYCPMEY